MLTQDDVCMIHAFLLGPNGSYTPYQDLLENLILCFDLSDIGLTENQERHAHFSFAVMGIVGTIVVILGLISNFVAFTRLLADPCKTSVIHPIFTVLVLWDIALLITSWTVHSFVVMVEHGYVPVSGFLVMFFPYVNRFMGLALLGVIWTTVAITATRCSQLCFRSRMATRAPYFWLGLVCMFAILFHMPSFFEVRFSTCCSLKTASMIPIAGKAKYARPGTNYFQWYKVIAHAVFVVNGPILLQTVFIGIMLYTLRRSKVNLNKYFQALDASVSVPVTSVREGERPASSCNLKTYSRLNRILWAIVIKFLICYMPCAITNVTEHATDRPGAWDFREHLTYLSDISNLLVMVHSATSGMMFLVFGSGKGGKNPSDFLPKIENLEGEPLRDLMVDPDTQNSF